MSITIEEGKFYRTKAGEKVGPMVPLPDDLVWFGETVDGRDVFLRLWGADGRRYTRHKQGDDIADEWGEPEHTEVDLRDIADQPEAPEPAPAFPQGMAVGDLARMHGGLTKREWFMGQFLAGSVASPHQTAALDVSENASQADIDAALQEHWAHVARAARIAADAFCAEVSP